MIHYSPIGTASEAKKNPQHERSPSPSSPFWSPDILCVAEVLQHAGRKCCSEPDTSFFFLVMEAKWRYPSYTPISSQNTIDIWISIDYSLLTTKFYYFYLDLELIWDVIMWIFNFKLLLSLLVHTGYRTHAKFSSSWGGHQYSQHDVPKSR